MASITSLYSASTYADNVAHRHSSARTTCVTCTPRSNRSIYHAGQTTAANFADVTHAGQTDGQTDGRIQYRFIDPAPHTMRAVPIIRGIKLQQRGSSPTTCSEMKIQKKSTVWCLAVLQNLNNKKYKFYHQKLKWCWLHGCLFGRVSSCQLLATLNARSPDWPFSLNLNDDILREYANFQYDYERITISYTCSASSASLGPSSSLYRRSK